MTIMYKKKSKPYDKIASMIKENEAVNSVLRAEKEARNGILLSGDLDELARFFKKNKICNFL